MDRKEDSDRRKWFGQQLWGCPILSEDHASADGLFGRLGDEDKGADGAVLSIGIDAQRILQLGFHPGDVVGQPLSGGIPLARVDIQPVRDASDQSARLARRVTQHIPTVGIQRRFLDLHTHVAARNVDLVFKEPCHRLPADGPRLGPSPDLDATDPRPPSRRSGRRIVDAAVLQYGQAPT